MDVFDVFISYSHKDQDDAALFRNLLEEEGWSVWIDENIPVGSAWSNELEKALDIANGIIVLWSKEACKSEWVQKEAQYALDQRKLFGIKLDDCDIPPQFSRIEAALLQGWRENMDNPEWINFLKSLAGRVAPSLKEKLRPGFDSRFLGDDRRVPWPSVYGTARQIHYLHFSVVANPARRLAWYVAYNVDMRHAGDLGARPMRLTEDTFIAKEFQPADEHFKGSGFDRGHLACRRSLGWGEDRFAAIAGRQAFYITNTAPQHPLVNRVSYLAVERWEQQVSENYGHVIVFCGPVLKDDDTIFRGQEMGDDGFTAYATFRIPKAYWKIVLTLDDQRNILGRCFYFINPDAQIKHVNLSKHATDYEIPFQELQALLSYIEFPVEIINAGTLPFD